jgi:hypothetical protein
VPQVHKLRGAMSVAFRAVVEQNKSKSQELSSVQLTALWAPVRPSVLGAAIP